MPADGNMFRFSGAWLIICYYTSISLSEQIKPSAKYFYIPILNHFSFVFVFSLVGKTRGNPDDDLIKKKKKKYLSDQLLVGEVSYNRGVLCSNN